MWPFGSRPTLKVAEKLAAVDAEIIGAQAELERVSLAAALSDDPAAGRDATERLDQLRQRRQMLKAAQKQAEIEEQRQRDEQAAKDFETRRRALAQHIGRAERAVAEVTKAEADLAEARRRLVGACQSIVGVLPHGMKSTALPFHEMLGSAALRSLIDVEAHRISPEDTPRPARAREFESWADGSLPTLGDTLGAVLSSVRQHFDARRPTPQAPPPAFSPVLSMPAAAPVVPDLPSGAAAESRSEPVGERDQSLGSRGEVIDLRGQDLGVPKEMADA